MTPARLFAFLCRHGLALEAPLALRWWLALCQSQASQCRWTVRKFTGYHSSLDAFGGWVWRALPPKVLVEVAEILYGEGQLSRTHATQIQNAVLARMAHGTWR